MTAEHVEFINQKKEETPLAIKNLWINKMTRVNKRLDDLSTSRRRMELDKLFVQAREEEALKSFSEVLALEEEAKEQR